MTQHHENVDTFQAGSPIDPLTEREVEVVALLAGGLTDREIARDLSLSLETVKWYNKRIYGKLGVGNRTQAAARARSLGLLDPDEGDQSPVSATTERRHNLPALVTTFVGRQREIARVTELLAGARLLSILGPAGGGKTRLALQVASEALPHFEDGICYVPLAPVPDVNSLLRAIAERAEIQFRSDDEPLQQVLSFFQDKTLLLVLDNFEHLVDGAGIVTEILRASPGVKALVTSRQRLNLYGEVIYGLRGLRVPAQDRQQEASQSEATDLFVQRARAIAPHLDLDGEDMRDVVRICRLVEGLPLAIELAATWMDVLSPGEIVGEIEESLDILQAELRDVPSSQSSMRAAIDRSWHGLSDKEQAAFRRVSVFRGGFDRHAVRTVAGVALPTLQALVNKSLLQFNRDAGRYELHELLRHYAAEKLGASGELPALREAHGRYFADLMAERWPQMKDRRQKGALLEVEADLDNAWAAWAYWLRKENTSELRKFFHTFWVIYDIRGWYPMGIDLFTEAIGVMKAKVSPASGSEVDVDVDAEAGLGWLMAAQGLYSLAGGSDMRKALALAQEGVRILRRLGRRQELIVPLISLFITAVKMSEDVVAWQAARDCLEIASEIGDRWAVAKAQQILAIQAIEEKQYSRADQLGREALAFFEESGDNWSKSVLCIEVLGLLAITLREFYTAKEWIERGLDAARELDFKYSLQMAYWQLGYIEALQENYVQAGQYWQQALGVGERIVGGDSFIGFGGSSNRVQWGGRKMASASDAKSEDEMN